LPGSPSQSTATGRAAVLESTHAGARFVSVNRDGSDGQAYPLPNHQIDIGRSEGELRFDDPHLGPRHARVMCRGGQHVIVPLETRNGVYVRIRQAVDLLDGDQFLIGKQVLKFELLPDVERALRPAVEHGVILFGTPLKAPWGRLRQLTAAGTVRDVYHLSRSDLAIGREQGDVVFSDDEFMSRRHALLQFRGGKVSLADAGSSNGTYVRLRAPHALIPGEMLRMGDELLRFELG
jgi:pSer/pThr/pTyr-binding forkhead associated (FHA) protein